MRKIVQIMERTENYTSKDQAACFSTKAVDQGRRAEI